MVSITSNTLVSMVSSSLMPFHSLCSRHYYELFSPQQPPLVVLEVLRERAITTLAKTAGKNEGPLNMERGERK
jgi:hypothetical protein